MKPEEAIQWLKGMMPEWVMPEWDYEGNVYCVETCYGLGIYMCTDPKGYVFKTAIEALEKQIPKKPKKTIVERSKLRFSDYCPVCGYNGLAIQAPYCERCGQAIDWSEQDDKS